MRFESSVISLGNKTSRDLRNRSRLFESSVVSLGNITRILKKRYKLFDKAKGKFVAGKLYLIAFYCEIDKKYSENSVKRARGPRA